MPTEAQLKYWSSLKGKPSPNKGKHWKIGFPHKPSDEQIRVSTENLTKWVKENGAWNKGKKGLYRHTEEWKRAMSERMKGRVVTWKLSEESKQKRREKVKGKHFSPLTELKKGHFTGGAKALWKGDKVSYSGLHHWVARHKGKPDYCSNCKRTDLSHRSYHWANIDHKYRRVLEDYIRLCINCHRVHDEAIR